MNPLRARGRDALASFYDEHAAKVREYCRLICPPALVDEATFVSFVDLLGRLEQGRQARWPPPPVPEGAGDVEEILWKATRGSAAGRAEVFDAPHSDEAPGRSGASTPSDVCRAMPELLAAYASGELTRNTELDRHLVECSVCRTTAMRFRQAEGAFSREASEMPPAEVRRVWLEIALSDEPAPVSS